MQNRTDGLADGAEHAQGGAVVALDGLVAVLHQRPDQRWRRVEHPHLRVSWQPSGRCWDTGRATCIVSWQQCNLAPAIRRLCWIGRWEMH